MFVDPSGHTDITADLFFEGTEEAVISTGSKTFPLVVFAAWLFDQFSIDAGETNEQITIIENKKEPYIFVLEQPDGTYILTDFEEINEPFSTEGISIIEKENHIYTSPMDQQQTIRVLYSISKSQVDSNVGALDQLGKELELDHKRNGNVITKEEAEIIDEWVEEYNVPQHHGVMDGSGEHWSTGEDHTHIRGRHIPYK